MIGGAYWALQSSRVQTFLVQKLTGRLSEKLNARVTIGKVDIALFKNIILEDVIIEDQKADTLFFSETIEARIDSIRFRKKKLSVGHLRIGESQINIKRDSASQFNYTFLIDSLKNPEREIGDWQFFCDLFRFEGSDLSYDDFHAGSPKSYTVNDLSFNISGFALLEDSLFFKINQLTLNDGKDFEIHKLNTTFHADGNQLTFSGIQLKTKRSNINDSRFRIELPEKGEPLTESMQIDFRFSHSKISFLDLARLIPSLQGMNQLIDCSGEISGTINDLKGRNFILNTGNNTSAEFDFYANGISNPEDMYLFMDLKRSQTTFSDLSRIRLPAGNGIRYLRFPEPFYDAGILTYEGNFTGFLNDFVAFGRLTSQMGNITTDLSMVPDEVGRIKYQGKIATDNFKLGELFQMPVVGELTFDGSVDGFFDRSDQTFAGAFEGEIAQVDINGYDYENIEIDGFMNNRMFDGLILMNDSNLQFDFLGKVNLNPEVPEFDFQVDLKKALPGNLNMSDRFPSSEMAFTMTADFSGNKLDNLVGSIVVENGFYKNRNGEFSLDGMALQSIIGGDINYLNFTSDFFDVKINGNYHFQDILTAFQKSMDRYIPALQYEKPPGTKENKFGYQVDVKKLDELMNAFAPGYRIQTPFLLYGRLDSEQSVFEMKGKIPGFSTENILIKDIIIGNSPQTGLYTSEISLGSVELRNGMKVNNIRIDSKIANNAIDNQINWGAPGQKTYQGTIKTLAVFNETENAKWPHIAIEGYPTDIYISDSLWQISPFTATIDSTHIQIAGFNLSSGNQQISMEGHISQDSSSILSVDLSNIEMKHWGTYTNKEIPLEGTLTGQAGIEDFYGRRLFFSNLNIHDFTFKDQRIGNVAMTNQWDKIESVFNSEVKITDKNRESLYVHGFFDPATQKMDYTAQLDHLSLVILETVIRKTFSNFHGDASGKVKIHGTPQKILLDGTLEAAYAGLTIDYTRVSYHFTDSVSFSGDTILFDQIPVQDNSGNTGIFDGTIVHTNFQDMVYNLSLNTSQLVAINTTPQNNDQFYGKVVARGRIDITGRGRQVDLSGSGTTLSGTDVNISLESQSEVEKYDFIRFVSEEDEEKQEFTFSEKEESEFSLNLTIRATPEARAKLIYNAQIGDVITAQGEGILAFGMDPEGNITLSGNYTVERGDYLFTLQNVINKRFTIEQGGTIDWSGDPYEAIIDIKAVYKLKASLYDLLANYENIYQSQRIPVECKILLSENLSNPEIDFEIDFPTVEDRLIDEVQQFFNTPEDMNKQILSLVVLGKFYTPEYLRGTYEAQNPNLIGTTASELFSNQLSNWLSQISSNVDIGFNYRPGNQITDDEIELALSTQMFNDRVTINGNIGNNNNPNSTSNSELVGDFEVNVKLTPNGKLQFKAYNRSNNNLIYETAPYTQGVGFSFTEDYSTINHLLDKMKAIFSFKKKKEEYER